MCFLFLLSFVAFIVLQLLLNIDDGGQNCHEGHIPFYLIPHNTLFPDSHMDELISATQWSLAELHWFCSLEDKSHSFHFKFVSKLFVLIEYTIDSLVGPWLSALILGTIQSFPCSLTGNLIYIANSLEEHLRQVYKVSTSDSFLLLKKLTESVFLCSCLL